jgi:hypothetical protein
VHIRTVLEESVSILSYDGSEAKIEKTDEPLEYTEQDEPVQIVN